MSEPISALGVSDRTVQCLAREDILTIDDLTNVSYINLLRTPNLGNRDAKAIRKALEERGLSLAAPKSGSDGGQTIEQVVMLAKAEAERLANHHARYSITTDGEEQRTKAAWYLGQLRLIDFLEFRFFGGAERDGMDPTNTTFSPGDVRWPGE